jgi:WhiB family redox-sensing transcriptional regulator
VTEALFRFKEPADLAWMEDAACARMAVSIFFAAGPRGRGFDDPDAEAKAVCADCSVQQECLSYALDRPETDGVWGGYGAGERDAMRRARRHPGRATR